MTDMLSSLALSPDTQGSAGESTAEGSVAAAGAAPAATAKKPAAARKAASARPAVKRKPVATKKRSGAAKAQPAAKKTEAAAKPAKKPAKLRAELIRDGFTMPKVDFDLIAALKAKALDERRPAKKSELLRAGLRQLSALDAKALVAALDRLEPVKIGRPKKGH